MNLDADGQGADAAPCGQRQSVEERKGYNMTMKEKIRVHVQIERENRRKLKEWKEGRKTA